MSDSDQGGETYGRAGGYNSEPGESAGEFADGGQAGSAPLEGTEYTGQTGTGYGRTAGGETEADESLRAAISAKLDADPFLDATHIEVRVIDAEATLAGSVTARGDKRRAEDLAKDVPGVARVHDELSVQDASAG